MTEFSNLVTAHWKNLDQQKILQTLIPRYTQMIEENKVAGKSIHDLIEKRARLQNLLETLETRRK